MPSPSGADLHINAALTNVSIAYFQDSADFIGDQIFPALPVDKRSDVFWKYSKSDFRRTDAEKRAPGTESAGIDWTLTEDNYYADIYAVHKDIDDQTRANADSNFHLDSDATRLVTNHLLLQRDSLWASKFFATGLWGVEYTGVGATPSTGQFLQWDVAGSGPLENVTKWKTAFRLSTGKKISFMVVGANVWDTLQNHAEILDRIKFTQTGIITEDLVARFFGIDKFVVCHASIATGPQINDAKAQDAAATYGFINNPDALLLGYAPKSPSLLTPSAGYTFNWKGYGAGNKQGLTIAQMRMQHLKSDRIEGEAAYVQKLVSADCGVFVNSVVST